ncbi:MAG: DUF1801 domain-containing protein [Acidobacteria bacterium]|nr:DUF1801 domain-containing protein [Acidobacteriota bacterium]MBI3425195.1 DUF1801 domain-containing protein [Acidobacteriota bacterium]
MKKTAPRPPSTDLLRFLAVYERTVGELALALREVVLSEAPTANEFIYDAYNAVAIAFTFTDKWLEGFCHIAVYRRYVNLGFQRGAELDDPAGVLKGTGKLIRHFRIAETDDLKQPHIRQYLCAAIQHNKQTTPKLKTAAAKSIVKGISPTKRRPR